MSDKHTKHNNNKQVCVTLQCFSLLGLNGAGKTTAFRCLTGDLRPSRGQILVNGLLLEEALELPRPILSYCPQSHALDPNLTPKEVLTNMARIRGAAGPRTKKVGPACIQLPPLPLLGIYCLGTQLKNTW